MSYPHLPSDCKDVRRTRVVCISGSMRFEQEMRDVAVAESLEGHIVVMPMVNTKTGPTVDQEAKERLDELHLRKIDLANELIVVCPGSYIGKSTRAEIAYATRVQCPIRYVQATLKKTQDGES